MLRSKLPVVSFVLAALASPAVWASALDGRWAGTLTCSENVANRAPGFKVPLDLALSGTSGTSDRTDAQTVETFAYQLAPSGLLDMQSQGRRRTDTDTRWVTRLSGDRKSVV
jgi:hypothetical protein